MVAVEKANAECVKLLISAKASVRDACAAETVFMAAVTKCIQPGQGERQRKVLKCLMEADFEFFQSCQEELQERAAEEADSDMYDFLCSRKRPRRQDTDRKCCPSLNPILTLLLMAMLAIMMPIVMTMGVMMGLGV